MPQLVQLPMRHVKQQQLGKAMRLWWGADLFSMQMRTVFKVHLPR